MADAPPPLNEDQRALVEKNLDLAHHLALIAWRKSAHTMDKEEVVAVAYEGLVVAASRFDPSRANVVDGVPDLAGAFAGFARQRINGAILDWQRSRDHVPRRQRSTYKRLQEHGLGQGRSPSQLSEITGLPEDQVRRVISAVEAPVASLRPELHQDVLDPQGLEEEALETQIRDAVVQTLESLSPTHQLIIALCFYEGLELSAIAQILEMRLSSVRVFRAEGLAALHEAMLAVARG